MTVHENQGASCNKLSLEKQQKKIRELLHNKKMLDTQRKAEMPNRIANSKSGKTGQQT